MRRFIALVILLCFVLQSSASAEARAANGSARPLAEEIGLAVRPIISAVVTSQVYMAAIGQGERYAKMHAPVPVFPKASHLRVPYVALIPGKTIVSALPLRGVAAQAPRTRARPVLPQKAPQDPLAMRAAILSPIHHFAVPEVQVNRRLGSAAQRFWTSSVALTAGINHYWTYEEGALPGVGKWMTNVSSGNLLVQQNDMDIPERGINLAFDRTYNSQSQHDVSNTDGSVQSNYGNGWTNTFDAHLGLNATQNVMSVFDINGTRYDYSSDGRGHWTPPPGQYATLTWDGGCGYFWTKKTGTVYYFYGPGTCTGLGNAYKGRLIQVFGRNHNNNISLSYAWQNGDSSSANNLAQIIVTHSDGHTLTLNFSSVSGHSLLTSLVRPDGATVTYGYDESGNLTHVSPLSNGSNGGAQRSYVMSYQGVNGRMNSVTSPNWEASRGSMGGYTGFALDGSLRVVNINTYGVFNYAPADGTDGSNLVSGLATGAIQYATQHFDYNSGSTELTDTNGHATIWSCAPNGPVTSTQVSTGSLWLVSNAVWDTNFNLVASTDARGNETDYGYDASGNTTWVQAPTVTTNQGTGRPLSRYSYDQYNNVVTYCDAQYIWNSGATTCAAVPGVTHYTWDYSDGAEPFGLINGIYMPGGYHTAFAYNQTAETGDFGLVTDVVPDCITQADGTNRCPRTGITYDPYGNVVSATKGYGSGSITYDPINRPTKSTDADGVSSYTCYNADGSVAATDSAAQYAEDSVACGNGSDQHIFDADGNDIQDTDHVYNENGVTHRWYDAADRLVEVSLPADANESLDAPQRTRYIYDSNQSSETFQGKSLAAHGNLFKTELYSFIQFGPLAQTTASWTDVKGNSFDAADRVQNQFYLVPGGPAEFSTNVYDENQQYGLLTSSTDAMGVVTKGAYDSRGDVIARDFSDSTPAENYTYDADGRVTSTLSALLGADSTTYDVDGNALAYAEPTGGGVTAPATYQYTRYADGSLRQLSVSSSALGNGSPKYTYSYRNDGLRSTLAIDASATPFRWGYTAAGRETSQSDPFTGRSYAATAEFPSGITLTAKTSAYDQYGRLSSLSLPFGGSYNGITYDGEGNLLSTQIALAGFTPPNMATVPSGSYIKFLKFMYDVRGALTWEEASPSATGSPLYNYGPFPSGTSVPNPYGGARATAQGGGGECKNTEIDYDLDGRETQNIPYGPNPQPNTSGCITGQYTDVHSYDAQDRTTGYTATMRNPSNALAITFGAGPHPRLIKNSVFAWTLHWNGDELEFVTDQSGTLLQSNYEDLAYQLKNASTGAFVLGVIDRDFGGQRATVHSASGVLNVDTPDNSSDPFYCCWSLTASKMMGAKLVRSEVEGTYPLPIAATAGSFVGMDRSDGYTIQGVTFQGARVYDSAQQQWTSRDKYPGTVNDPISQNSYMWNRNNPISYADPSGFDPCKPHQPSVKKTDDGQELHEIVCEATGSTTIQVSPPVQGSVSNSDATGPTETWEQRLAHPDFATVQLCAGESIVGGCGTFTGDACGHTYFTFSGELGKTPPIPASMSAATTINYLTTMHPTEAARENALKGWGYSVGGGFIAGAQASGTLGLPPSLPTSVGAGFMSPQLGVSGGYTWQLPEEGTRC